MAGGRVQTVAVPKLRPSSMTEGTDIRRGRHFGADLAEFYSDTEPIHLLVKFLPTTAIFRLVNSLRGVSPCRLWQEFPDLRRHYWQAKRSTQAAAPPPLLTGSPPAAI